MIRCKLRSAKLLEVLSLEGRSYNTLFLLQLLLSHTELKGNTQTPSVMILVMIVTTAIGQRLEARMGPDGLGDP